MDANYIYWTIVLLNCRSPIIPIALGFGYKYSGTNVAMTRIGQKHASSRFQCVFPKGKAYRVDIPACVYFIHVFQLIHWVIPVVGNEDKAIHAIHLCLGISDFTASTIDDVFPFVIGQSSPHTSLITAVADGIINAPVRIGIIARKTIGKKTIRRDGIIIRPTIRRTPIPPTGAIAEQVNPSFISAGDETVVATFNITWLVF